MALEGNISDFSIPEILQLISSQRKNGVLTLTQGSDEAAFDFEEGYITGGYYKKLGRQEHISEYLFKTGLVSEAWFLEAEEKQKALKVPIEEILIEQGFLSQDDFEEVIRFKIQEIMDEVFTWIEGHYVFDAKARLYTKSKYPVRLAVDSFLLEGMRRLDEWLRIKKVVPSLETVVKARPEAVRLTDPTPEQSKLLEFLGNKHLSVNNLVSITGLGKFVTCQTIAELLELKALELTGAKETSGMVAQTFDPVPHAKTIALLAKQLGLLIRNTSRYPFNHSQIISNLDGFSHLLGNLPLGSGGVAFSSDISQTIVNGRPIDDPSMILSQFALYLNQRQIIGLTFLPQLRDDELRSLAFLMALPPELAAELGGFEQLSKLMRWPHIRLEAKSMKPERLTCDEKVFVIPSGFLELAEGGTPFGAKPVPPPQVFSSLRTLARLPQPRLSPEHTLMIEEADQAIEKVFGVYARGGREKYIEKVVAGVMKLSPPPRLVLLKRKLLDIRWLFPIDNVLALSHSDFERL